MHSKGKRQTPSRRSLMMVIILLPVLLFFFFCGMYIGSQQVVIGSDANGKTELAVQGLPGTNNKLGGWSDGSMNYLRGAAAFTPDSIASNERKDSLIMHKSPGVENEITLKDLDKTPSYIPVKGKVFSNIERKDMLKQSLHAKSQSYMKGSDNLDSENILVGAWINLDDSSKNDNDMRTIFSNKKAGCGKQKDQYGLSMYVNAWETKNHKLYVEYGGLQSGCNKISSSDVEIHPGKWYHVAVYLSMNMALLYIDGTVVGTSNGVENHQVQNIRPLLVGQYDNALYPLYGNISHLAVIHSPSDWTDKNANDAVKMMMDINTVRSIKGLQALYPFMDTSVGTIIARDTVGDHHGTYIFPIPGTMHPGISIELFDGVGVRPVTPLMKAESDQQGRIRREDIKNGMKHAWKGYKTYAWGRDELKPLSKSGTDPWGGMGVTLVDSLDTLWIMGMKDEFKDARDWVEQSLSFHNADSVSVFETTIRELGGLLSAHDLSGDKVFLTKAVELADLLMPAFNTPSGIPRGSASFKSPNIDMGWSGEDAVLSELGSLQIDFRYLSVHTKDSKYESKAMKALQVMNKKNPANGLFPIKVSTRDGSFTDTQITLGALGDSFYEYLLKVWLQGGKKEQWLRDMYDKAMDGVMSVLLKTSTGGLAFLSDNNQGRIARKMDHLVCFIPGVLALGAHTDPKGPDSVRAKRDLAVAKALMHTCHEMYSRQESGIAPEYVEFPETGDMVVTQAPFYILRPETAESLFILNQLTGEPIYRDWGYDMFQSMDKHCRTEVAYGALRNVKNPSAGIIHYQHIDFFAHNSLPNLQATLYPCSRMWFMWKNVYRHLVENRFLTHKL